MARVARLLVTNIMAFFLLMPFYAQANTPSTTEPQNGQVITDQTPTFRWSKSGSNVGYKYALVVSKSPRRASDDQYLRFWVKKALTSKSFTWNGSFEERVRDPVTGQVSVVSNSSPSLLSHRTYYWHVVAIRNGVVTKSRESTFTIVRPMAIPTGLNVPSTKEIGRSFNIAWNSVSGASRYELRRRKDTASSWQTIYNGGSREYTETHLDSGRYYYSVRACNGSCSDWSQQDYINITFQPPSLLSPNQSANTDVAPCFEWEETGVGTTYGIAVSTSRRANDGRYNRFLGKKAHFRNTLLLG